jgi:phosphopantothenoylcysteine decarboxylase / phosphopantothenate---cysteine ligase
MRILVSAGPTREFFDTVRFISNPSSGKMGYAIARAARRRGHQVVLVSGPVALRPPRGVEVIQTVSAAEMSRACKQAVGPCDAVIMTAAVCDYTPDRRVNYKLKKQARPESIRLAPTEDILAAIGRRKGKRILIGFAMEDRNPRKNAESKLRRKHLDAILLNGPENVAADTARMELLTADGTWESWPAGSKTAVATKVVRLAERLIHQRQA